jgi:glycosyltransferase involved in cell wall biosynthesis
MKILLIATDIYESSPNGGSKFYKSLIENNQQHQFYYRTTTLSEQGYLVIPKNVHITQATEISGFIKALLDIGENQFDIIDIPSWDFDANSTIHKIKEANITFKEIFLGLHGNSSDIEINSYIKTVSEERIKEIQASETAILNTADICYSLSYETLKQTKIIKNRKKIVINPFSLISTDINTRWNNEKPRLRYRGKIVLGFAGRPEGTKGLDFLLKYVQKFHHKGIHYSLALSTSVRPSEYLYVNNFLILDCEECTLVWNLNQTEMNTFYKSIDYLVAPSRYDAFNLTVLESFSRKIKVLASDTTGAVYSIILNGKRISDIYIYKHNNFKSFCRELTRMIKNKKNYKIWHISIFYKFFKLKSIREVQIEALYE